MAVLSDGIYIVSGSIPSGRDPMVVWFLYFFPLEVDPEIRGLAQRMQACESGS